MNPHRMHHYLRNLVSFVLAAAQIDSGVKILQTPPTLI